MLTAERTPEAAVRGARVPAAAVAAWVAVLVVARVAGLAYVRASRTPLAVGAVPWVGRWATDAGGLPFLLVAALIGAAAVWWLPVVAVRMPWRGMLAATAAAGIAFTLALVQAGPPDTRWPGLQLAYGRHTGLVDEHGAAHLLRTWVGRQQLLGGHLRAHPPGMVFLLWAFERIGLSGTGFQLALMLGAGAVSSVAVLVMLREVAGEPAARAAAPFVVLAPVVVWRTNPDVVFGAIALAGVALVVLATGRSGRRRDVLALGGGLVFAAALLCTYGVALLALPALVVGWQRRAVRALALAAAGGLVGLLLPAVWGFSWWAGLQETRLQYRHSLSRTRGYRYWLLGNAATFLGLLGPATVVGLTRLRGGRARGLVLGGLACAVLAGLSGMSSAETERIWQPFAPLVLLAGGVLWSATRSADLAVARRWLALQAGVALAFQATLQSPW